VPESSAFNIPHSPIAAFGSVVLLFAFLLAAYGAATGIMGSTQHRRRMVTSSVYALYAFFGLMMLASALMIYAFVTHDYTIKYVAHYSDTSMPLWYKITAYWGGLDGSLMFWVAVLSAFSAVAVWVNHQRHRDMIGYVVAVTLLAQIFFLGLLIYNKNPFATFLTTPPLDGKGLNPLLQNYWMVIHPPSLYLGFVAATIPFAFGMAALASGRLDDRWLDSVRSWMMICWFFLSLGLILGGRWAYEELARPHPGRPLGLRGARLGRLLGLGSGGERRLPAVVHGVRVPALDHDPEAARHAQGVERGAGDPHLLPHHLRHLHDPQRRGAVGARVR
jgi:cytochrome c-type biogenesis protein CcmF